MHKSVKGDFVAVVVVSDVALQVRGELAVTRTV